MTITSYNKWCKENETERFWDSAEDTAYAAWKAATLAERERFEKIVSSERKFIEENYCDLPGEIGQYYGGRLDAYDNVLNAIRNPNE